jgi:hypothetical protein
MGQPNPVFQASCCLTPSAVLDLLEDTVKLITEICCEGVDWICLAQDLFQWQGLVNMAMNCRVS